MAIYPLRYSKLETHHHAKCLNSKKICRQPRIPIYIKPVSQMCSYNLHTLVVLVLALQHQIDGRGEVSGAPTNTLPLI